MKNPLACFLQTTTRLCTRLAPPCSLLPDEVQSGWDFERWLVQSSPVKLSFSQAILALIKQSASPFKQFMNLLIGLQGVIMVRSTLPADPPLAGPSGSFATFNANLEKMVFLAVWRIKTAEKRTFGKKHALFCLSSTQK